MLDHLLNEEQDPRIVEKVHARISEILMRGEEIMYIAVRNVPGIDLTPDCVVLTNKRFIIYRPKLLGRVEFEDYIWRDLHDAQVTEALLGATLTMKTTAGATISVDYLPKAQARRLYALAEEMEERMLEERRFREMEEKRAAAGGVIIQGQPGTTPFPGAPAPTNPVEKLRQLKEMLDAGLITQEQYDAKRQEVLASM